MLFLEILLGAAFLLWLGLGVFHVWAMRGASVLRPEQGSEVLPHTQKTSIFVPARNEKGRPSIALESLLKLDYHDESEPLPRAPKVSIILAARDEEEILPSALDSLLKLDYPDYEVILVDDNSTDRTGLIADDWARDASAAGKLKVIHNRVLPPGWTGKVHALSLAAHAARGEWILATDADVVLHPAILRLALSFVLRRNLEFLSLAPEFKFESFWEKVVLPAFSFLLATMYPLRLVNHPKSSRAIAAGAFMLMRRDRLEALGGYERLRHSLIEDVRMAELFKRKGRPTYLALTRDLFRTRMYRDARELWEGLSRSAFEGSGYSMAKVFAGAVVGTLLGPLPWVTTLGLLFSDCWLGRPLAVDPALLLALATCAVGFLVYFPFVLFYRVSPLYVFTLPLATVFYSAVALNSALQSVSGGGVSWKGRRYRPPNG